jgi:hypothetical protein
MTEDHLRALAAELEAGRGLDAARASRVAALVAAAFARSGAGGAALDTTDGMLALLAESLPSWSVHLTGHSATVRGRWTCTIRETGVRDDDELIGVGKAEMPASAVAAALVMLAGLKRRTE